MTATPPRRGARDRGYDTRWERAARGYRAHHPYCLGCRAVGKATPTTVVDHIRPHRGNSALFWSRSNWQPCCEWHHNTVKKTLEAGWDRGEFRKADLRLDSSSAVELTRKTRRLPQPGFPGAARRSSDRHRRLASSARGGRVKSLAALGARTAIPSLREFFSRRQTI
jgi:5-methylcytosine-specific restriction protein A